MVNNVFDLKSRRWQEHGAGVMFGNEVNIIIPKKLTFELTLIMVVDFEVHMLVRDGQT